MKKQGSWAIPQLCLPDLVEPKFFYH